MNLLLRYCCHEASAPWRGKSQRVRGDSTDGLVFDGLLKEQGDATLLTSTVGQPLPLPAYLGL